MINWKALLITILFGGGTILAALFIPKDILGYGFFGLGMVVVLFSFYKLIDVWMKLKN